MNGKIVIAIITIFLTLENSDANVSDEKYLRCLDEKKDAENELKQSNTDAQQCYRDLGDCQTERDDAKQNLGKCTKEKDDITKEKDGLTTEKQKLEDKVKSLGKEKDDLTKEKDGLAKEKQQLDDKVKGLGKDKEDLTKARDGLTKEKQQLDDKVKSLGKEKDDLTKEKDGLAKEKQQLDDKVKGLGKDKDDLTKENKDLKDKIKEFQKLDKVDPAAKPIADGVLCVDKIGSMRCFKEVEAHQSQCKDDFVFGRFQCCKSCVKKYGGDPTKKDDPVLQFISTPKVCQDAIASDGTSYTAWCQETVANKPKDATFNCDFLSVISRCTKTCGYCKN